MDNGIIKYDNSKSIAYVQSIEKIDNDLLLRKNLAVELGLTSIGEFNEGWAIAHKDGKWIIINKEGKNMTDDSIPNLTKQKDTNVYEGKLITKEYLIDGNRDIITEDDTTTNIIKSSKWIFPAKDGIIIVIDDWKYANGVRLYTTAGQRVPIPTLWSYGTYAIVGLDKSDNFSKLHYYYSANNHFDYRDNIIDGLIPINPDHNFLNDEIYKIQRVYNLYNSCGYTLINTKGQILKTELGYYYANTKRGFDFSHGLYPSINPSFKREFNDECNHTDIERPIFYMVDKDGKCFRDEFNNIVYSDDPYRINTFNKEKFAVLEIDPKVWGPEKKYETNPYLCIINKDGRYLKNADGSIKKIYFEKYIYTGTVTSPDVRGYDIMPNKNEIKVLTKRDKEYDDPNKREYKKYDYKGEEIVKNDDNKIDIDIIINSIDFGLEGDKVYNELGGGLIEYQYYTQKKRERRRIINTNFNNKLVKSEDGSDFSLGMYGNDIIQYKDGYFFEYFVINKGFFDYVKINGLIARNIKDAEGTKLEDIEDINVLGDKYVAIRFQKDDPYYILDENLKYIKDSQGKKISSKITPYYTDGMFLIYKPKDDDNKHPRFFDKDMDVEKAYFEDGTLVGETIPEQPKDTLSIIVQTKKNIKKIL